MKRKICIVVCFLIFGGLCRADGPGPPPPPGAHAQSGNQGPAGAPIDGGLGILLLFGAGYGARKYFRKGNEVKGGD